MQEFIQQLPALGLVGGAAASLTPALCVNSRSIIKTTTTTIIRPTAVTGNCCAFTVTTMNTPVMDMLPLMAVPRRGGPAPPRPRINPSPTSRIG